jgi:hypothetical protein
MPNSNKEFVGVALLVELIYARTKLSQILIFGLRELFDLHLS